MSEDNSQVNVINDDEDNSYANLGANRGAANRRGVKKKGLLRDECK